MFLGQFSSRTRKMTLEQFLNGQNRTNFENRKNAEIAGNSVKMAHLGPSPSGRLGGLQRAQTHPKYWYVSKKLQSTDVTYSVGGFDGPESVPPSQNFVATPLFPKNPNKLISFLHLL